MIVDAHLHIWRAVPAHPHPDMTIVSPVSDVPVELLNEYMNEHQVERAVLVQPLYPGEDNRYVADTAAAMPERFAAVCVVDPRRPEAPNRLEYWVRERGCKGLRLRPRVPDETAAFNAPKSSALWDRVQALKVVVSLLASPQHLQTVARWAERYPDVAITLDHMAYPDIAAGIDALAFQDLLALARYPGVFVKVSGYYYHSVEPYPYRDCWTAFRAIYDTFGADRLIWGSDFPHVLLKTDYRRNLLLQERAYTFLSSHELGRIMGENAAELYWS